MFTQQYFKIQYKNLQQTLNFFLKHVLHFLLNFVVMETPVKSSIGSSFRSTCPELFCEKGICFMALFKRGRHRRCFRWKYVKVAILWNTGERQLQQCVSLISIFFFGKATFINFSSFMCLYPAFFCFWKFPKYSLHPHYLFNSYST